MHTFKKILFPVDFSQRSRAVAPFVLSMAQRYASEVTLLHAVPLIPTGYADMNIAFTLPFDYGDLEKDLRARLREFAQAELPALDIKCIVEIRDPAALIIENAENRRSDLIMMPTHGYGTFRRALLGSVTARVLHDAECPVWTSAHAPEPSHRAHPQPRLILAAVDLRPESRRTIEFALDLARNTEATVEIVHAAPEGQELTPLEETDAARIRELLVESARSELIAIQEKAGTNFEVTMAGGGVAAAVRSIALRKRADLIVIGRGCIQSGGPARLKANAYAIIREAPCPVLSV